MQNHSTKSLIHALIGRVSKGGFLLLNTWPLTDGTFHQASASRGARTTNSAALGLHPDVGWRNHSAMALRRLSITVTGRVQGVGFRYFTQEAAEALGVTGWVRNGWSRDVEAEAQAEAQTLAQFCERLREGPTLAHVADLETHEIPMVEGDLGFEIRY
jgi:acylphosphatase